VNAKPLALLCAAIGFWCVTSSIPARASALQQGASVSTAASSDTALANAIRTQLAGVGVLDRSTITVEAKAGVVIMSGRAASEVARARAVRLARQTPGVKRVIDKLTISRTDSSDPIAGDLPIRRAKNPAATPSTDIGAAEEASVEGGAPEDVAMRQAAEAITDSWTTAKVQSQFIGIDVLDGSAIRVSTHGGIVTLSGTVRSAVALTKAESIARSVVGVTAVQNRLMLSDAK
jgi:osmotically-inducible protein OsmY